MAAHQAPPSLGFSRQEHWSGLPFSFPGDLPNPGTEPRSPSLQPDSLPSEPPGKPIYLSAAAKSLQLCPTLCDPIDGSPPGSPPLGFSRQEHWSGCHFLLQCMKVKSENEVVQSCPTLSDPHGLQPTRLLHPWDFPGKSTGVGCHCLLRLYTLNMYNCYLLIIPHKAGERHIGCSTSLIVGSVCA